MEENQDRWFYRHSELSIWAHRSDARIFWDFGYRDSRAQRKLSSKVAKKVRESGPLTIQVLGTVDLGPLFQGEEISGHRLSGI
jgi:hypothetical protein